MNIGEAGAVWFLFALSGMLTLLVTYHEFFGARPDEDERRRGVEASAAMVEHLGGGVVVVDDDRTILRLMSALLSSDGILSRTATSLEEVLPFHPEDTVLVTDWRLQHGTGAEVIAAYRLVHPNAPVLVVSALQPPPDLGDRNAMWVPKPFDPANFLAQVRKAAGG